LTRHIDIFDFFFINYLWLWLCATCKYEAGAEEQ